MLSGQREWYFFTVSLVPQSFRDEANSPTARQLLAQRPTSDLALDSLHLPQVIFTFHVHCGGTEFRLQGGGVNPVGMETLVDDLGHLVETGYRSV